MKQSIEALLRHSGVSPWAANARLADRHLPTGFPALDAKLPGGGWPMGAVTEILTRSPGIGELQLIIWALAQLSREGRWLVWVAPPHIPYAPALTGYGVDLSRVLIVQGRTDAEQRWAAEQALRSNACGAVLQWSSSMNTRAMRRLQLAAEHGRAWAVVFLSPRAVPHASPAGLRLHLAPTREGLEVKVLKCQGQAWRGAVLIGGGDARA
ncbi:MAG: translesion DNA synthesis-associated protein ImuA [Gammaproteobacteria bacterium]